MQANIGYADEYSIPRIAQLTQRTNQFSLTTRRYSEANISRLSESAFSDVFYLRLRDKFGDNGIVGLAIVIDQKGENGNIGIGYFESNTAISCGFLVGGMCADKHC